MASTYAWGRSPPPSKERVITWTRTDGACPPVCFAYGRAPREKCWAERAKGELRTQAETIAKSLRRAAPELARRVKEADRQHQEELKRWEEEKKQLERKWAEERRIEVRKKSRQEMLDIVASWSRACELERFFGELQSRAQALEGDERDDLLGRLESAREIFGGTDVVQRFRGWKTPEER